MQVGLKGAHDCVKAFSETDLTEDLRRIDVPTLIIHGDDDQIVPISASALKSSKLVKDATLKVYPGPPWPVHHPQGPVQRRPARLPQDLSLQHRRSPTSRHPSVSGAGRGGRPRSCETTSKSI
jgi:dienelactone hydrolase